MTVHKLWTKMAERDWRTVVKALYILHCVSRDSMQESCKKLSNAIKWVFRIFVTGIVLSVLAFFEWCIIRVMSKSRNIKSPDHLYFDISVISDLNDKGQPFEDFVSNYAKFVLYRAKTFSGRYIIHLLTSNIPPHRHRSRFQELLDVKAESQKNEAVEWLRKAKRCIDKGWGLLYLTRD